MNQQHQDAAFEWNADIYHTQSTPQFELAMELLDQIQFRGDEVVIDAGCGSGRVTEEILQRVPRGRVIAIDASANMVHKTRELVPAHGDRIQVLQADLQKYCVPEQADLIFSSSTLHFIEDHRLCLQNFAQTVKPGGQIALRFGTQQLLAQPPFSVEATLKEDPKLAPYLDRWLPHYVGGDAIATKYYLQEAGFVDISVDVDQGVLDFSTPDQDSDMFTQSVFVDDLTKRFDSEELREYFLARLKTLWQGGGRVDFEYITVHAQRPDLM